jgi:CRP-like cAMP-binding protein
MGAREMRVLPPECEGEHMSHTVRNRLLAALPPSDFAALAPALQPVSLDLKQVLIEPDRPIGAAYFPESGMVSMLAPLESGALLEVGIVGREGMVGLPIVLGGEAATTEAMVQMQGTAWRVRAAELQRLFDDSAAVRSLLLRYVQAFHAQVAQTAACNNGHPLEVRLVRWLLMLHDRAEQDEFPVTHEFMAMMLGVSRPSVSLTAASLQRTGAIAYAHGRVTVLDRPALEGFACECYGTVRRQFERLLGTPAGE